MIGILEKQLGASIDFLTLKPWTSGTADLCHAFASIKTAEIDSQRLLTQINEGLSPRNRFTFLELGLYPSKTLVVDVVCTGKEGQQVSTRFMQLGSGKLLAIDEEASLLTYE